MEGKTNGKEEARGFDMSVDRYCSCAMIQVKLLILRKFTDSVSHITQYRSLEVFM